MDRFISLEETAKKLYRTMWEFTSVDMAKRFLDDIPSNQDVIECHNCKKPVSNKHDFCPWCGAALN